MTMTTTKQLEAAKALLAVYRDPDARLGLTNQQADEMRRMAQSILIRLAEAETLPTSAEAQELMLECSDSEDQQWRYVILLAVRGNATYKKLIEDRGDDRVKKAYAHHQARYDFGG
jgi:hypothetical protein